MLSMFLLILMWRNLVWMVSLDLDMITILMEIPWIAVLT